jgi:Leucine-rich repeat (LRR) protein
MLGCITNDRDRSIVKSAIKACLSVFPGHKDLLDAIIRLELQNPKKQSMSKLKSLLSLNIRLNPIAAYPWQMALVLEILLGKQKSYPITARITQIMAQRGMALHRLHALSRDYSAISLSLSSQQLYLIPPSLCMLSHLQQLDLSCNAIMELPDSLFLSLSRLKVLNLAFNSLLHLPGSIVHLTQLQKLNVSHNHIREVPILIGHLTQLHDLDLSCNLLVQLPSTFAGMKQLRRLNMQGNLMTLEMLSNIITWPCMIQLTQDEEISSVRHVSLLNSLGPCTLCAENEGKTQRFNAHILCPKCILLSLIPLL